jgi:hypothetical protein
LDRPPQAIATPFRQLGKLGQQLNFGLGQDAIRSFEVIDQPPAFRSRLFVLVEEASFL